MSRQVEVAGKADCQARSRIEAHGPVKADSGQAHLGDTGSTSLSSEVASCAECIRASQGS